MKQHNIDNLTSLWLLASGPFKAYRRIKQFNVIELDFSEWPNRVWPVEKNETGNVKEILQHCKTNPTFTKWISLKDDEHMEAQNMGLTLKSIQIGMSLNLQNYHRQRFDNNLFLDKVDNEEKGILWSDVFQKCFNYHISHKIVDKIKAKVAFYLITNESNVIGCVATFTKDNQIGIHSLGILDIYRKQGFAEAVMDQLLQNAKENKLENAHLQSSMLGLSIYKKIGFEQLFKMCNYKI